MKILEGSEVTAGNAIGKGGGASLPFGRGYYTSGDNNGSPGITFTPAGEPSFKTYKSMKHSKKKLKNKMKHLKTFEMWSAYDVSGDFKVNYGDKKSKIVEDTIKFVEDNFDNMSSAKLTHLSFKVNFTDLDFNDIHLYDDPNTPYISFSNSDGLSFDENLNPEEYNQLAEFFKSINIKYKNKKNNAKKDVYFKNLQNKRAEKYNL